MAMSVLCLPGPPTTPPTANRADRADRELEMRRNEGPARENCRPREPQFATTSRPAIYPTTTSGGWTVVHHGILAQAHTLEPFTRPHQGAAHTRAATPPSASPSAAPPPGPGAPAPRRTRGPPPPRPAAARHRLRRQHQPSPAPPPAEPSSSAAGKGKRLASVTAGLVLDAAYPRVPGQRPPAPAAPPAECGPTSVSIVRCSSTIFVVLVFRSGPKHLSTTAKPTASSAHPKSRSRTPDRRVPYGRGTHATHGTHVYFCRGSGAGTRLLKRGEVK
ncbi:hypothetical protein B0H14DRAFT_2948786 [Mycena olivaceomarginata]|nr:hypothetical protein B0H14DRAFT_2948786 [Mycena olivaceomarginata]